MSFAADSVHVAHIKCYIFDCIYLYRTLTGYLFLSVHLILLA